MSAKSLIKSLSVSTVSCLVLVLLSPLTRGAEQSESTLLKENVDWSADGNSTMTIEGSIRRLNLNDNVRVTQGTLVILGDNATLEYDEPTRELIRVTVHGTPVRYSQDLASPGSSVKGNSNTIVLYSQEGSGETVVELTGNAYIESPDTTLSCASIVYLPALDLVPNTTGPCVGSFNQE